MTGVAKYNGMMSHLTRPPVPKTQVANLVDDLEPGPLKDELQDKFDPSQETYEEYLQRKGLGERPFNAANGGSPKEEIVEPPKSMQVDTTTRGIGDPLEDFKEKADRLLQGSFASTNKDFFNNLIEQEYQKALDAGVQPQEALSFIKERSQMYRTLADEGRRQGEPAVLGPSYGRQNKAIGGGVIEGEDLGTREGFASIKKVKNVEKTDLEGAKLGNFYFEYRNPDYKGPGSGTPPRLKEGPFKTEKAAQKAYDARQEEVKVLKGEGRPKKASMQTQAINNFVTNFYNENLDKYEIRDYDKFEKDLLKAYEKADIPDIGGVRGKYLRELPHVGTKDYSRDPISLFGIQARNPSGKSAGTDFKNFFKKTFFTAKLQKNPELVQNIKRFLDYYNIDKKYRGLETDVNRAELKKQYADVLDPKVQSDILYMLESDEVGTGKLRAGIIKQFLPEEHGAYIKKKDSSGLQYKALMNQIENDLSPEQLKKALGGETSIKKFMDKQTALLNEIFDTSELKKAGYSELIFNADHLEGMAEIARMNNPEDQVRALKNLIGTTSQRNYQLGFGGFSSKRKGLITDINNGINVKENTEELNKITKAAYPEFKGDLYRYNPATKSVIPTENFRMEYTPETAFKQYFTELVKSPVGLKEVKKQYKNNPQLQKLIKQDPKLASIVDPKDLTNVQKVLRKMKGQLNSGMDPKLLVEYLGAEMKDLASFGQKYGGDVLGKVGKGITGVDLPIFQTMFASMYDIERDSPVWLTLPAAFTDEVANIFNLYNKSEGRFGLGKVKDFGKFVASSFVPQVVRSPVFKAVSKVGKIGSMAAPLTEAAVQGYRFKKMKDARDDAIRQFDIPIEIANKGFDDYIRSTVPQDAFDELNVPESPGLPKVKRGIQEFASIFGLADNPYEIQKVRGDVTGTGLTSPMALQRLYDRQGLDEGGPPDPKRRMILKMLGLIPAGIAGLASLRFGPKKVKKIIDTIKTTKLPGKPEWFDTLVNKVIREGTDMTKQFATKDREIVHATKISDDEYVRVHQDLDEGTIRVDYDSPFNMGEETVSLEFRPGIADETTGGKKPRDRFQATEVEPRYVGGPEDTDMEFDGIGGGSSIKMLESDVSNLEKFATGKNPTMKEFVESKKRKDRVKAINEDQLEAAEYISGKYGDGPEPDYDDFID